MQKRADIFGYCINLHHKTRFDLSFTIDLYFFLKASFKKLISIIPIHVGIAFAVLLNMFCRNINSSLYPLVPYF